MPTAVVRVVVDEHGELSAARFDQGLAQLRRSEVEVMGNPVDRSAAGRREIAVLEDALDRVRSAGDLVDLCTEAFGLPAALGVITYLSRGTDEDAAAVLDRFDVAGTVERQFNGDEEIVIVTISRVDTRRVPESRLHTALEAALNAEVHIRTV